MKKTALAIGAHPDDIEFLSAGTLALLHQKGWEVHIATMTAGDCGSKELGKLEISEIRKKEAAQAARIIGAKYTTLGFEDLFITYDRPSILKVVACVRTIRPDVVLTMGPSCYMLDHEITSRLVQTGCFGGGLVNIETAGIPPMDYIPHLYYMDPMEGKDILGNPVKASALIDVTGVMDIKTRMLECHQSQREWLRQHHGMDAYILSMKRHAENRGREIGVRYAEGFRQHLGHAYPQDDLIAAVLPGYAHSPH